MFFLNFLNILPSLYCSLNANESFIIDMIEQGFDKYFYFSHVENKYFVECRDLYNNKIGVDQFIEIIDIRDNFSILKKQYMEVLSKNFPHIFKSYFSEYNQLHFTQM